MCAQVVGTWATQPDFERCVKRLILCAHTQVKWNPSNSNWLLTASRDQTLKVRELHAAGGFSVMEQSGVCMQRIRILRCIVFNAYYTVLNRLCCIVRLQDLPKFAEFWPF
jgi:hypothetical protein